MFENSHMPLATAQVFFQRMAYSLLLGSFIIILSLGMGMLGYYYFEDMTWLDSFLNASMILSGMGPVGSLTTEAGKIFAGLYALFCGLAFMVILGVVFAPVVHRVYHKFHLSKENFSENMPITKTLPLNIMATKEVLS